MNVSDLHFTITAGGIGGIILLLIGAIYRLGRILERFDNHVAESNQIHKAIDRRLTWLERNRRLMEWKTWQLVPVWMATCLGTYLLTKEMIRRFVK